MKKDYLGPKGILFEFILNIGPIFLMSESNLVGLSWLFSQFLNYFNNYRYNNHLYPKNSLILMISLFLVSYLYFDSLDDDDHWVFGHFFGTTNTALPGAQNQTVGNYVVELLLNPAKPMIGKDVSFMMQIKSTAGDELIELPVSFYMFKDGKPVFSDPNNYTLVSQGHHDFNYTFSEPGKYVLFVDIKDIFYTLKVLSINFEIDVQEPIIESIGELISAFFVNYYYVYIPILGLLALSYAVRRKRHKDVK